MTPEQQAVLLAAARWYAKRRALRTDPNAAARAELRAAVEVLARAVHVLVTKPA